MPEKRTLPWLNTLTKDFLERDIRNEKQIMSITAHNIGGTKDVPEISFDVVGSTGSVYKTIIGKVPRCNCPDVRFRKAQCKHICFVLSAMDVPGILRYQRSFLPSELRQMLASSSLENIEDKSTLISAKRRKPVEGKCPICFNGFSSQGTMLCHACGNNVHEACFKEWETIIHASKDVVCCLYCQVPWKRDCVESIK